MPPGGAAADARPPGGGPVPEQVDRRGHDRIGQLLEGTQVIEDPDAPAVGGRDEVAIPGVDDQIVDRDGGHPAHQTMPGGASIHRRMNRELGPDIEQARVPGVFRDDIDRLVVGQRAAQAGPGAAVVGGPVEVGGEVVAAMAIEGDIGGSGIVA